METLEYSYQHKYNCEDVFGFPGRVKILRLLALNKNLNITKIFLECKQNYGSVQKHLEILCKMGLVAERQSSSSRIFRYKRENIEAKDIEKLINLLEVETYPNIDDLFYSKSIIKIIKILFQGDYLSERKIREYSGLNYRDCSPGLNFLIEKKIILCEKQGNTKIYSLNDNYTITIFLKILIQLIEPVEDVVNIEHLRNNQLF